MIEESDKPQPHKRNLVFAALHGMTTGLGTVVATAAAIDGVARSWNSRSLRLPSAHGTMNLLTDNAVNLIISGAILGLDAQREVRRARAYNRNIHKTPDSFVAREQEKQASGIHTPPARS